MITRADGLPVDAVPEDFAVCGGDPVELAWINGKAFVPLNGMHAPSYVQGWRWGFVDGLFVGALLTAAAFLLGMGQVA